MDLLRSILKCIVPAQTRMYLRTVYRRFVFRRAMKRFLRDPAACVEPGSAVLADLIYGWGNAGYIARDEYLVACIEHALRMPGAILECGSGLSTLLIGAIAQRTGQEYWALEHTPRWAATLRKYLEKYNLDNVRLCVNPLKNYGDFYWYDAPVLRMPACFSLIICDGPPSDTKGGRYGLVPIMRSYLNSDSVIFLDDAVRQHEREVASRWTAELGGSYAIWGQNKPYIVIQFDQPEQRRETVSSTTQASAARK